MPEIPKELPVDKKPTTIENESNKIANTIQQTDRNDSTKDVLELIKI